MPKDSKALMQFGKTVKRYRHAMGISQERLADHANFDRTYVSLVERGKRNVSLLNICRFANALNTSPSQLLEDL
jgi:transcriptional regulator with XRE-family HTH domain